MYDLYQDSILKRGMIILREDIKEKHGKTLLNKLADVWARFYGSLLPMLQIIFHMMTSRGLNIRQLTLQNFRDFVLLKTEAKEAIFACPNDVPAPIRQMLLVLLVSLKYSKVHHAELILHPLELCTTADYLHNTINISNWDILSWSLNDSKYWKFNFKLHGPYELTLKK